jgi:hypothetical protein
MLGPRRACRQPRYRANGQTRETVTKHAAFLRLDADIVDNPQSLRLFDVSPSVIISSLVATPNAKLG